MENASSKPTLLSDRTKEEITVEQKVKLFLEKLKNLFIKK